MRTHSVNKTLESFCFLIHDWFREDLCCAGISQEFGARLRIKWRIPQPLQLQRQAKNLQKHKWGHILSTRTLESFCFLIHDWFSEDLCCAGISQQFGARLRVKWRLTPLVLEWLWKSSFGKTQSQMKNSTATPAPKSGKESSKSGWRTHSVNEKHWNLSASWSMTDSVKICAVLGSAINLVQDSESNEDFHNHSSTKVRWRKFKNTNEDTFCQQDIGITLLLDPGLIQWRFVLCWDQPGIWCKTQSQMKTSTWCWSGCGSLHLARLRVKWRIPQPLQHQCQAKNLQNQGGGHILSTRTLASLWFLIWNCFSEDLCCAGISQEFGARLRVKWRLPQPLQHQSQVKNPSKSGWRTHSVNKNIGITLVLIWNCFSEDLCCAGISQEFVARLRVKWRLPCWCWSGCGSLHLARLRVKWRIPQPLQHQSQAKNLQNQGGGHILSTRTLASLWFLIWNCFSEDLCCAGISQEFGARLRVKWRLPQPLQHQSQVKNPSKSGWRTHSVNKNIGITLLLHPWLIQWRFVLCWD